MNKQMTKETFVDNKGRKVIIEVDEDDFECRVKEYGTGVEIGEIAFRFTEGAGHLDPDTLHIINMHLEGADGQYLRSGIGRKCLQLALEYFGAEMITAGRNDGTTSDDGSHLTGDAPGFIRAMRREGLVLEPDEDSADTETSFGDD